MFGPWRLDTTGLVLSVTHVYKPVTVAILALVVYGLLIVTIIGILATLAAPSYYQSSVKAKETALKHNL